MEIDYKSILLKRVDLGGLLIEDVLGGVIKPALEKLVADSENKFDDSLYALIYPQLEAVVKKFVDDQLAKLKE